MDEPTLPMRFNIQQRFGSKIYLILRKGAQTLKIATPRDAQKASANQKRVASTGRLLVKTAAQESIRSGIPSSRSSLKE
ncbi:hypothetical protein RUM43_013575 [Polyplax serrata]|uniref:Uncharacterized protein n=1 Tax=Polyplax serrata TaxID=468196 RepID=A0AAN8S6E3_POLSC